MFVFQFVSYSENEDFDIGANPSEEEQEEALNSASTTGIDVILQNRLVETSMSKAQYKKGIKEFCKKLLERVSKESPERAAFLKGSLPKAVAKILEGFDDYSTYVGESSGEGGCVVLAKYPEDTKIGCTIDVYVWKDAVVPEKQVS